MEIGYLFGRPVYKRSYNKYTGITKEEQWYYCIDLGRIKSIKRFRGKRLITANTFYENGRKRTVFYLGNGELTKLRYFSGEVLTYRENSVKGSIHGKFINSQYAFHKYYSMGTEISEDEYNIRRRDFDVRLNFIFAL